MFDSFKDIIGIKELREMLGTGRDHAYTLVTSGEIPAFRIGNVYKIPKGNVIKYIENQM